jgi:hypothetical protein
MHIEGKVADIPQIDPGKRVPIQAVIGVLK